jgi:Lrp/AsnC family leucine-responsive transcriptional regulator
VLPGKVTELAVIVPFCLRVAVDKFDQQILALLRADARLPVSQIAREVNLSRSAVSERIRQLEQAGVIRGYQAQVALPGAGAITAYLEVFYQGGRCEHYVERMRVYPEVRRCSGISGETDMLVVIEAPSMQRLSEVRGEIENFPGIQKVKTHMVVKDWVF